MELKDVQGQIHNIDGCLGCNLSNGVLKPFEGMIYKDDDFNISQDFELPINGFIIIATNEHIISINELTDKQRYKLIELENRIIKLLKDYKVCDNYRIIFEEKNHFHVWLMPEHNWMKSFGKPIYNIDKIFDYAKNNLRTEDNLNEIRKTCKKLKKDLNGC